jgi:hypothetical protein
MTENETVTLLRRATDGAVQDHHLDPAAAATAWTAAHVGQRRSRHIPAIVAAVVATACLATVVAVTRSEDRSGGPDSSATSTSACGTVSTATLPAWARTGFSTAGLHTPHVISDHGQMIGALFVQLRVHQPPGTNNKILWVARDPGFGPLRITAQLEASGRTVARTIPDGPGPSIVDMPAAGCWRMTLRWSGHSDTIAFRYAP